MDKAADAFRRFKEAMDSLDVQHYRAVATSAVRESDNGKSFVKRIYKETGIHLETINGQEEARLIHVAIKNKLPLDQGMWMLADLGGGSVEVSLADDSGILWSESHTMGSVRLLEELAGAADDPGRFRRVLADYTSTLRLPGFSDKNRPLGLIATGGNVETLAQLSQAERNEQGILVMDRRQLAEVIETLSRLSYQQRVKQLGLREDRADVILPAAMVYERLAELGGMDRIFVPSVGVREGTILDLIDDLVGHDSHEDRLDSEAYNSAVNRGRRYLFDEGHAVQTAKLSQKLFDATKTLHGLGPAHRRVLTVASLLHDIGSFVSRKKHHHHSQYLISHTEIAGLNPRQMEWASLVARYHRKAEPLTGHAPFDALDKESQDVVQKLSSMIRVADALDREHRSLIKDLKVEVKKTEILLTADADDELILERFTLRRRAALLESLTKRKVRLRNSREIAV